MGRYNTVGVSRQDYHGKIYYSCCVATRLFMFMLFAKKTVKSLRKGRKHGLQVSVEVSVGADAVFSSYPYQFTAAVALPDPARLIPPLP